MIKREEQRLGNYRLSRLLGTGVFADVYLGEHLYLNTLATIKVLHAPLDPQAQASFLTEARHLSRLIHPHIIRVLEFGLQDQVPYLIMDIEAGEANMTLGNSHLYVQNLPGSLTPMIGREHDLQAAYTRLLRPHVRLLTLTGTLGVGKTRLALTLGDRMLDEFAQGVCFVSLASINDPDLLIPTIIHTFGLPESRDHLPFEQLVAYLRDKQLLLLLDNFEHLLPAASQLSELLAACPQLKLLVTSRATLHVQGEYEFAVPPLAIPDPQSLARARPAYETLSQMAAVELFVQCAEAARPGFALTEENAAVIAEICVRLEGLPLAIELAAARCKVLSLQALLSRLEHRLAVLTGGRQDAPLRQQTLRDTIAWSYDLLSPEMQMLFRCLCVFVGDFTLDAAEAVVSAAVAPTTFILDGIISLVDSSLVQRRDEEGIGTRLHILEALREYGMERLAAHEELERCQNAHAVHYLALAEQAEPALDSATQALRRYHG